MKPVFDAKCLPCHGAAAMGKLDLRTGEATLKGGACGPVAALGMSEKSLIIDKVVTRQMPPGKNKLTDAEIDSIRKWIDKGLVVPVEVAAAVIETEVRAVFRHAAFLVMAGFAKKVGSTCERLRVGWRVGNPARPWFLANLKKACFISAWPMGRCRPA